MCFANSDSVGTEVFFQVIQKPCFGPCPRPSAEGLASMCGEREKGHHLFFSTYAAPYLFQVWPGTRKQITLECSGGVAFFFTFFLQSERIHMPSLPTQFDSLAKLSLISPIAIAVYRCFQSWVKYNSLLKGKKKKSEPLGIFIDPRLEKY